MKNILIGVVLVLLLGLGLWGLVDFQGAFFSPGSSPTTASAGPLAGLGFNIQNLLAGLLTIAVGLLFLGWLGRWKWLVVAVGIGLFLSAVWPGLRNWFVLFGWDKPGLWASLIVTIILMSFISMILVARYLPLFFLILAVVLALVGGPWVYQHWQSLASTSWVAPYLPAWARPSTPAAPGSPTPTTTPGAPAPVLVAPGGDWKDRLKALIGDGSKKKPGVPDTFWVPKTEPLWDCTPTSTAGGSGYPVASSCTQNPLKDLRVLFPREGTLAPLRKVEKPGVPQIVEFGGTLFLHIIPPNPRYRDGFPSTDEAWVKYENVHTQAEKDKKDAADKAAADLKKKKAEEDAAAKKKKMEDAAAAKRAEKEARNKPKPQTITPAPSVPSVAPSPPPPVLSSPVTVFAGGETSASSKFFHLENLRLMPGDEVVFPQGFNIGCPGNITFQEQTVVASGNSGMPIHMPPGGSLKYTGGPQLLVIKGTQAFNLDQVVVQVRRR